MTYEKDGKGYRVLFNGEPVGRVERRATTKTGFRHGRCIGQVAVNRWFAWDADGKPVLRGGLGRIMGGGGHDAWDTRDEAARALIPK